ncbi:MAG: hypothetical protein O7A98_02095, partial [Acidobacteria bacterium]|nr:hypothetical protein [Acidobacteriota bacterium]
MAAETARKWLHLAPGVLALAVRDLGYPGSLGLTLALLAFNLWLLPRLGGGRLWRPAERLHGAAPGILFYPVALVILAVATRGRPEVLAGAWGMLACGDAAATLAGRRWGRRRLPWNEAKSWVGSAAFLFVSWAVIAALVAWTAPGRYGPSAVLAAAALAALAGAVVESLPWILDDNLSVTLVGGGALYIGLGILAGNRGFAPAAGLDWSVALLVLLALLALVVRAVDVRGALTGLAVASGVWLGTGWRGLVMLALLVGLGTAASRLRRRWAGAGGVEPARGVANVLANGAVAGTCGLLAAWQ